MNKNIDIPLESLNNPGNIWINKASKQLRYSLNKNIPSVWLQPLSIYQVGNEKNGDTFLKRGQPVSIGFLDELALEAQNSGAPSVVPTNPHKHQWCIGLALEPGNSPKDSVHVLPYGQIEYHLNCKNPHLVYQPPNENGKYLWTYEDIGKPVMVSNYPGEEGGLTIDITHAYYNGANIVTVGRIADAPISSEVEQKIVLEVNLAGDTRGMIDSTQFSVKLSNEIPVDKNGLPIEYTQDEDRLIFVKVIDDIRPNMDKGIGIMVTSDEILLENGALNSPVGCFLAKSKNGKISLKDYVNKDVLLHRLGIIESKFNFVESEVGKDLFFSNGKLSTVFNSTAYEYKVGIVLDKNRVLVDCRYPKQFMKSEMVGKIKLAYMDKQTHKLISDPGYVIIDPNVVHKVKGAWEKDAQYKLVDFSALVEIIMHQDIIQYSDTETGPFTNISGDTDFNKIKNGFFKFKNVFYSVENGTVATQIKFSNEGAPDNIQYIWPEQAFEKTIDPANGNTVVWDENNSPVRCNINHLYNLGAYTGGGGNLLESYDIICKAIINENESRYITPGFYSYKDGAEEKWCGFEWAIVNNKVAKQWQIVMVTNPNIKSLAGVIPENNILGFCYPAGKPLVISIKLLITIRRRPIQYHNLFLNQLASNDPWKPMTDGTGNLVTDQTLYFGEMYTTNSASDPVWNLKREGANSITFNNYQKTNNIYKKLLKYSIGPYVDIGLSEPKLVNQLIIEYLPVSYDQSFVVGTPIRWIYDFKNNYTSLNADFGAKLITNPTTKDIVGTITETFVEVQEDYVKGQTNSNPKGDYDYPRSALQTLHEIPIQFFSYTDDKDKSRKKIYNVQESWDVIPGSTQRYQPQTIPRDIFPPKTDGTYAKSTQYKYTTNTENTPEKQGEWEHIHQEINYLFNTIKRDNAGVLQEGGDISCIQTYLGLLSQASKETQQRLLKLERSIFGKDYFSIPGEKEKILNNYSLSDSLTEDGSLRRTRFLVDSNLFETVGDPKNLKNLPFISDYKTILWDLYGDYKDKKTYIQGAIDRGLQYDFKNHFHDMYIWWLGFSGNNGVQYHLDNPIDTVLDIFQEKGVHPAVYDARRVYFGKHQYGYFTESGDNVPPSKRHPFLWPIKDVDLVDNFFNSTIFGKSDTIEKITYNNLGQPTKEYYRTVDNQSLEGVLWDIMCKLSWVKDSTDSTTQQYHKNFVNMFVRKVLYPIPNSDKLEFKRDFRNLENTIYFDRYYSIIKDPEISSFYSAFSLIEGKIHNAHSLTIKSEVSIENSTAHSRKIHEYIDIRSKPLWESNDISQHFEYASEYKIRFDSSKTSTVTIPGISPNTKEGGLYPLPGVILIHLLTKRKYAWVYRDWHYEYFDGTQTIVYSGEACFALRTENAMDGQFYKCSHIPTGWYTVISSISSTPLKVYFINKGVNDSLLYTRYKIIPPNDLYKNGVYFHFPNNAKGKKSFSSQQYVTPLQDLNINLGHFVLADGFPKATDKNKIILEERTSFIPNPLLPELDPKFNEVQSIKYLKLPNDLAKKPITHIDNSFEEKIKIPTKRTSYISKYFKINLPSYTVLIDILRGTLKINQGTISTTFPELETKILQDNKIVQDLEGTALIENLKKLDCELDFQSLSVSSENPIVLEEKQITIPEKTVEFIGEVNGVSTTFKNLNPISFNIPSYNVVIDNLPLKPQKIKCLIDINTPLKGTSKISNFLVKTQQTPLTLKGDIDTKFEAHCSQSFNITPSSEVTTNFETFYNNLVKELDSISGIIGVERDVIYNEFRVKPNFNQHPVTLNVTGKSTPLNVTIKIYQSVSGGSQKIINEKTGYIFKYESLVSAVSGYSIPLTFNEEIKQWKVLKEYILKALLPRLKNTFISLYGEKECIYEHDRVPEKAYFGETSNNNLKPVLSNEIKTFINNPQITFSKKNEVISFLEDELEKALIFDTFYVTEHNIYVKPTEDYITETVQSNSSIFESVSGAPLSLSGKVDFTYKDKDDLEGILLGKKNSAGIYNIYNSGYIYGTHLTDNVDLNVAVSKKEIGDSLKLVYDYTEPIEFLREPIYGYTLEDVKQLKQKSTFIKYKNCLYVELNEKDCPKFKNYSYSLFEQVNETDNYNVSSVSYEFRGIVDSNIMVIKKIGNESKNIYIIPGICTNVYSYNKNFDMYLETDIPVGISYTYNGEINQDKTLEVPDDAMIFLY